MLGPAVMKGGSLPACLPVARLSVPCKRDGRQASHRVHRRKMGIRPEGSEDGHAAGGWGRMNPGLGIGCMPWWSLAGASPLKILLVSPGFSLHLHLPRGSPGTQWRLSRRACESLEVCHDRGERLHTGMYRLSWGAPPPPRPRPACCAAVATTLRLDGKKATHGARSHTSD
jgi:hypothetical protein